MSKAEVGLDTTRRIMSIPIRISVYKINAFMHIKIGRPEICFPEIFIEVSIYAFQDHAVVKL